MISTFVVNLAIRPLIPLACSVHIVGVTCLVAQWLLLGLTSFVKGSIGTYDGEVTPWITFIEGLSTAEEQVHQQSQRSHEGGNR